VGGLAGLTAVGGFEVVNDVIMVGGKVVQVSENVLDGARVADQAIDEIAEDVEDGAEWVGDKADDAAERARELGKKLIRRPPFGPFR
jgi:hypothetical protein